MLHIFDATRSDKRLRISLYLSLFGLVFLFCFCAYSLFTGNTPTGLVLVAGIIMSFLNLILLTTKYASVARTNLAIITGIIGLSLLITGGNDGTGHLWIFPNVAISLAVLSYKEGLKYSCGFIVLSAFILSVSSEVTWIQNYESTTATRYLFSLLTMCIMILVLVNIQEQTNDLLEKQTVTDELTGLYNRGIIQAERRNITNSDSESTSYLLLMDIDKFKQINDNFGHATGDKVLIYASELFRRHIREGDLAIRWGGEEFLIVLNNCSEQAALSKAQKLRESFQESEKIYNLLGSKATISIGVSKLPAQEDFDASLKTADANLYSAKAEGRNRVVPSEAGLTYTI